MSDSNFGIPSSTRSDEELIFEWITEDDITNITAEKRACFVKWSREYENLREQGGRRCQPEHVRRILPWKDKIIAFTNRRRADFFPAAAQPRAPLPPARLHSAVAQPAAKRVFGVAELRENVLRRIDTRSQLYAWSVSQSWRDTVEYIFQSDYHSRRIYDAVEYGDAQVLGRTPDWLQPSSKELGDFEEKAGYFANEDGVYAPARLSQAVALAKGVTDILRHMYAEAAEAWATPLDAPPRYDNTSLPVPQWLDFTQFQFAPSINKILGGRFKMQRGRCEVSLRANASPANLLLEPGIRAAALRGCVGTTFVTQPPCQTIGIYAMTCVNTTTKTHLHEFYEPTMTLLTRIHDTEGIRLFQLLDTLQNYTVDLLNHWNAEVMKVQKGIEFQDPQELYHSSKDPNHIRTVWSRVAATPKFVLLLDKHTMMQSADWHGHYSRASLLLEWHYKYVLTDEWMNLEFLNQYIDISMVTDRPPVREDVLWLSGTMDEAEQTSWQLIYRRHSEQMKALRHALSTGSSNTNSARY